jgi:hypothetical protein
MTSFLERLEQQLVEAVERSELVEAGEQSERTEGPVKHMGSRSTPLRMLALAVAIALALAAVALAASGMLLPGSPVPATQHLSPNAWLGVPAAGRSRLMAMSAPDPAGGLPWSMRIVHTTRRLVCLQVGRLYRGQIGILGEQDEFHDDKRFHPLPPDAISPVPRGLASVCLPDIQTTSLEASGVTQSGGLPRLGNPYKPSEERRLYFGLLGPDAVSVTYRSARSEITMPVESGTGAYLIVLPSSRRPPRAVVFGGRIGLPPDHGRLVPAGPLVAITYRTNNGTCVESWSAGVGRNRCSHAAAPRVVLTRRPELHRPIRVTLRAIGSNTLADAPGNNGGRPTQPRSLVGGVYYEATVTFAAPFAVVSALSGYTVVVPGSHCNGGDQQRQLERNVRSGQVVHVHIDDLLDCGKGFTVEVLYYRQTRAAALLNGNEIVVGRTKAAIP